MVYFYLSMTQFPSASVMQRFISSTESFPLLAIPLYYEVGSGDELCGDQ